MNPGRLFILAPPLNSEWHRSPRYLRPHGRVERVGASRTRVGGARALHCGDPPAPPRGRVGLAEDRGQWARPAHRRGVSF